MWGDTPSSIMGIHTCLDELNPRLPISSSIFCELFLKGVLRWAVEWLLLCVAPSMSETPRKQTRWSCFGVSRHDLSSSWEWWLEMGREEETNISPSSWCLEMSSDVHVFALLDEAWVYGGHGVVVHLWWKKYETWSKRQRWTYVTVDHFRFVLCILWEKNENRVVKTYRLKVFLSVEVYEPDILHGESILQTTDTHKTSLLARQVGWQTIHTALGQY